MKEKDGVNLLWDKKNDFSGVGLPNSCFAVLIILAVIIMLSSLCSIFIGIMRLFNY